MEDKREKAVELSPEEMEMVFGGQSAQIFQCPYCARVCSSQVKLNLHKKTCPKRVG